MTGRKRDSAFLSKELRMKLRGGPTLMLAIAVLTLAIAGCAVAVRSATGRRVTLEGSKAAILDTRTGQVCIAAPVSTQASTDPGEQLRQPASRYRMNCSVALTREVMDAPMNVGPETTLTAKEAATYLRVGVKKFNRLGMQAFPAA
jgi:hypothetical protein